MRDRLALTLILAALPVLPFGSVASPAWADESVSGADLYEDYCEMCHEVGGVGIAEEIPPLAGNRRVQDTEYLARVIREGVSGAIELDGQTYDEEMEGFPELSDAELAALIDYIQSGFPAAAAGAAAEQQQPELLGDLGRGEAPK